MPSLLLAHVNVVAAIQHGDKLYLHVAGTAAGFDGSLQIVKDDTRIYPPSFGVFERPGNCGITGQCGAHPVVAAAAFSGRFRILQVRTADGILHPPIAFIPEPPPPVKAAHTAADRPENEPLVANEWRAWETMMGTRTLHVRGVVMLPTPGHVAKLAEAQPQGINPRVLLLELRNEAPSDPDPDVMTAREVAFEKVAAPLYDAVHVKGFPGTIPVEYVS